MQARKRILVTLFLLSTVIIAGVAVSCIPQNRTTPSHPETTVTPTPSSSDDAPTTNKITIVTFSYENKPNPPYYLGSGTDINWDKPGITLEVLKSLENTLNVQVRFVRNPWQRGLSLLEENQVDGVFHASFKPERMELGVYPMKDGEVDPSKRIMTNAYYLYKLKDSPLQWDGEKLNNLDGEIGAIIGYAIVGDLQEMGISVYEGENQIDNFRMLLRGRLVGVAAIGTMNDLYLEAHPEEFGEIVKVEPPLSTKDYYVILSHQFVQQHPQLALASPLTASRKPHN
jgi:polar amino acid transport system substrate-binding protein